MIAQPIFWIFLLFLFKIYVFLNNRISFHPVKGFDESLWTRFWGVLLLLPLLGFGWALTVAWDFRPSSWLALSLAWKLFTAGIVLWVLGMWMDHAYWLLIRGSRVPFRLVRREKIKMPKTLRAPFGFLKVVGFENQIYQPEVVEYEVRLPHWPKEFSGITLVQVSDVHMGKYIGPEYLRVVLEKAKRLKPDIFAFTGDFVAFTKDIPRVVGLFKGFRAPLGVYAVLGNHDRWDEGEALIRGLKRDGIRVLVNQTIYHRRRGKTLAILGADDLWFGEKNEEALLKAEGDAKILLAHHPDHFYLAKKTGAHLQISGHCHGGQICFPLIGPLIVPAAGGRKYASGFVRVGDQTLFINQGIGCYPPLRTFCPPQIVKLILKSS